MITLEMTMKNRFGLFASLLLLLTLVLGCSLGGMIGGSEDSSGGDSTSSSDSSSSSSDSSGSSETIEIGIPECDEFLTYINEKAEPMGEDNVVVRGIVQFYKESIFSGLKESVEKMNDEEKAKVAENCKTSLEKLKKQIEE